METTEHDTKAWVYSLAEKVKAFPEATGQACEFEVGYVCQQIEHRLRELIRAEARRLVDEGLFTTIYQGSEWRDLFQQAKIETTRVKAVLADTEQQLTSALSASAELEKKLQEILVQHCGVDESELAKRNDDGSEAWTASNKLAVIGDMFTALRDRAESADILLQDPGNAEIARVLRDRNARVDQLDDELDEIKAKASETEMQNNQLREALAAARQACENVRESSKNRAAEFEKIAKGEHPDYVMRCDVGDRILADDICYRPTGETRAPKRNENYQYVRDEVIDYATHDWDDRPDNYRRIYRRIDAPSDDNFAAAVDRVIEATVLNARITDALEEMQGEFGGSAMVDMCISDQALPIMKRILLKHLSADAPADATSGETEKRIPYEGTPLTAQELFGKAMELRAIFANVVSRIGTKGLPNDLYVKMREALGFHWEGVEEHFRRQLLAETAAPAPPAEEAELDVWKYRVFSMDIRLDSGGRRVAKFSKPDDADKFHEWLKGLRVQAIDAQNWHARIRELEAEVEQLNAMLQRANEQIEKKDRALMSATPAQPAKPETGKAGEIVEYAGKRYRREAKFSYPKAGDKFWHDPTNNVWIADQDYTNNAWRLVHEITDEPAPSPHVEIGGQEPLKCGFDAQVKLYISGFASKSEQADAADWLNRREEIESQLATYKRDAEAWEKDHRAMEAVRGHRMELSARESFVAKCPQSTKAIVVASDPADAFLSLASPLKGQRPVRQSTIRLTCPGCGTKTTVAMRDWDPVHATRCDAYCPDCASGGFGEFVTYYDAKGNEITDPPVSGGSDVLDN